MSSTTPTENKTDHEDMSDQEEKCEFTPCKTGPNTEPRKVISHIFGRNKALTKRFPACVWVHYCRQHYQRARYRARDWPVTQCQLVLVSLTRMEEWADSGIEGFRVVLRRRVTHPPPPPRNGPPATGGRAVGRRVTRSSTSSSSLPSSAAAAAAASTRKTRKSTIRQVKSSASEEQTSGFHPNKEGNKEGQKKQRKKPTIIPSPVPAWLRAEADATRVRSFAEVRDIVERLKEGFEQGRDSGSGALRSSAVDGGMDGTVRFPDIEILPVFRD